MEKQYVEFEGRSGRVKAWVKGVPFEEQAKAQVLNAAALPFVKGWVAVMPDVHAGKGSTVGSVIPLEGAVIPAAVGVDIGCGMTAVRTSLRKEELPQDLGALRKSIEKAVPHGRSNNGGRGDRGAWTNLPARVEAAWEGLRPGYERLIARHPKLSSANAANHLGSLGTGNHFVEVCVDEESRVWLMLHSGSRGIGNAIGSYFIQVARQIAEDKGVELADKDLAWLEKGTRKYEEYLEGVLWAQDFAKANRALMMEASLAGLKAEACLGELSLSDQVDCHHNYVSEEEHLGSLLLVTRKGAVRAARGDSVIIPGSMGARSFIAEGLGNPESFHSCSHGAGRAMSRTAARARYTLEDHKKATEGVECRKDKDVIDETPMAYKDIDAVMEAQKDLVKVKHTLKQVVCVKG